jgi:hypothetical protein
VRGRGQAGAPPIYGSWALAFRAHIITGCPDWQPWYHDWQSSGLWEVPVFMPLRHRSRMRPVPTTSRVGVVRQPLVISAAAPLAPASLPPD